jgi:hypothetical protein
MKRWIPCSLVLLLISSAIPQVRENPKHPLHPNPGRVLNFVEVLKIKGEGEGYYFEGARDLEIDRAGNLYICDSWSSARKAHLPKFSPEGKFVKDLYRQGEGPGEILSAYDFVLSGPDVFLFDLMKRKIVVLDSDGNFKAEFKKATSPFGELIGVSGDWIVFLRSERPTEIKTSQLYEKKSVIVFVSKDGKTEKEFYTFANQEFFISLAQGGGSMNWDPFTTTIGDDRMYVSSTQQYKIQVLDLKTAKIVSSFKRDYPRVEHVPQDWEKKFASQFNAPKRYYENDISDLSFAGGLLWVRTSTESKEKGALYDLFDVSGRFVDSFYVNIRGRVLKVDGKFLYASIADENDLPLLVKYRIAEPIGAR